MSIGSLRGIQWLLAIPAFLLVFKLVLGLVMVLPGGGGGLVFWALTSAFGLFSAWGLVGVLSLVGIEVLERRIQRLKAPSQPATAQ